MLSTAAAFLDIATTAAVAAAESATAAALAAAADAVVVVYYSQMLALHFPKCSSTPPLSFYAGLADMYVTKGQSVPPNLKQYSLPVFCVSSHDCCKLEKVAKSDGRPAVFSRAADTGVPALRTFITTRSEQAKCKVLCRAIRRHNELLHDIARVLVRDDSVENKSAAKLKVEFDGLLGKLNKEMQEGVEGLDKDLTRFLVTNLQVK